MVTLADIRAKYPGAYDHVDDQVLADALYKKHYSHADRREFDDRIGLKPYQNFIEASGTAIANAPGRAQMGLAGVVQAGGEGLNEALQSVAEDPDQFAGATERPEIFKTFASYDRDPQTNSREEIDAKAEDYWQRFQDPARRENLLKEIGTATAKTSLVGKLNRQKLQSEQTPIDVRPGSPEAIVAGAIGSVAEMTPALAASIATRNPLPAMMFAGVQAGGQGYASGREQGLSPEQSRQYGALYAAAEAIPEALPLGVILREGGTLLAKMAKGAVAEGFQEGFTEALQFALDKGFIDESMEWGEAWPRIKEASITGAIAGPLMGAIAQGGQAAIDSASGVSKNVLGSIADQGRQAVEGSIVATKEFTDSLRGKSLKERIEAYANLEALQDPTKPTTISEAATDGKSNVAVSADSPVKIAPSTSSGDLTTIDRIIGIESGGDPSAQNSKSSAGGLGQFIDSTWIATVKKHAPQFAGLSNSQILAMKTDASENGVGFQRQMLEGFTQDNATALLNAGIEATDGNLYLAHFLGVKGATDLLAANSDSSARSVLGDAVIEANPFLADMSVADVARWATRKMGRSAGADFTQSASNSSGTSFPADAQGGGGVSEGAVVAKVEPGAADGGFVLPDVAVNAPTSELNANTYEKGSPEDIAEVIKLGQPFADPIQSAMDAAADIEQFHDRLHNLRKEVIATERALMKKYNVKKIEDLENAPLTPEEEDFLYFNNAPVSRENISELINAFQPLDTLDDAQGALRLAATALPETNNVEDMSDTEQAAVSQLLFIGSEIDRLGGDPRELIQKAVMAQANRFSDPDDALFMAKVMASKLKKFISATKESGSKPASVAIENKQDGDAGPTRKANRLLAAPDNGAGTKDGRKENREPSVRTASLKSARKDQPKLGKRVNSWDALTDLQSTLPFKPGKGHVDTYRATGMPSRPTDNRVTITGGEIELTAEPTRRDEPRKKLLSIIGERLYQQKISHRKLAGLYRQENSEVRVKRFDDIEIMAHEAAHWLDFHKTNGGRFTNLRQIHADELNPLSYTTEQSVINLEGFAEYVRLWATNYAAAKEAAPGFTEAFERELKKSGLSKKMRDFQKSAHRWYFQGTLAQFRGKSGESNNFLDNFNAWTRSRIVERFLQGFVDSFYAAKVIERETTGTLADAQKSAWKLYRMTAGGESMTEAVLVDGTVRVAADGSYEFRGKSLQDVFMPVTKKKDGAKRFDLLMEYFKARRARELTRQGRENLFTAEEISAGLGLAKTHPEFEQVFTDYQKFNSEMLDFYVQMGLITPKQRVAFAKNNTEYVPFHRVLDKVGGGNGAATPDGIKKRLTGGEQNTREIAENIVDGLAANIQGALIARAKARLFQNLDGSQEGSEFAVKIAPGSKPLKVALDQYKSRFAEILVSVGYEVTYDGLVLEPTGPALNADDPIDIDNIEVLLERHPELLQFWMHNQKPGTTETHVEPVIIDGGLRWFEVNSPLLVAFLTAPRAAPLIVRAAGAPKRFLTKAITSMPQFMVPNLVRDTTSAGALTQSKFRPFIESGRGLKAYLRKSKAFKEFRLNGGLFGGRIDEGVTRPKTSAQKQQLGVPADSSWDAVGRALAGVSRIADPFEQASRVGQFIRAKETGVNPLEAAFEGREISTDFAQMGRNEIWRWLLQTIPFAGAGLQGANQMVRNMAEQDGKVRLNGGSALKLSTMALTRFGAAMTVSTALLWLLNNDDDRYKALTVDEKSRFWHVWLPTGQHIQIPKPYGVGFIFADMVEISLDFAKAKRDDDPSIAARAPKDAAKQLAFGIAMHFWFLDYPGILQPSIEAAQNKKFTGAPIIPQRLQDVDVQYQYNDRTPSIYKQLGKTLNISPLISEHYVKGFTGYLEAYMVDATEHFLWDKDQWGERPFGRGVFDYFTHQFNGKEVPYRTKWTEGYYDLRKRASGKAATYRHLFSLAQSSRADLTEFTESQVNLVLRNITKIFANVDRSFSKGNDYIVSIRHDPNLSVEQKEQRIEAWYRRKNDKLKSAYTKLDELISRMEKDTK